MGVLSSFASHIEQVPLLKSALRGLGANFQDSDPAETEEEPQDMYWGEAWAATVVQAVMDFLDLGQQPRTGLTVRVPPNSGPSGPVGPERTAS